MGKKESKKTNTVQKPVADNTVKNNIQKNNVAKPKESKKVDSKVIEEVINERRKLPEEVKNKISNSIFFNILLVMFMMIITLVINIMFNKFSLAQFENIMKIVQITVCLISIAIFEYAYKKDSFKKALYGIEFVLFSVAVLYVPYMFNLNNMNFLENVIIVYVVYYIVKSIVTAIYYKNKYLKENMSDVKEIVKDDKKGYLDEESKKTLKEHKK